MKKYCLVAAVCLISSVVFSQTQPAVPGETSKDTKTVVMPAMVDSMSVDKKALVDDTKKKKAKKERSHKECSRMKS